MNLTLPWKRHSSIGVEISTRSLRAVQLVLERGVWNIAATAVIPRGGVDTLTADIRHLVESLPRRDFVGHDVVLAAPPELLVRAEFDVDATTDFAEVTDRARRELASNGKCTTDSLEIAWWTLPQCGPPDKKSILAVGCRTPAAEAMLLSFDEAGLTVIALETPSQALSRWTASFLPNAAQTFIALNIGWSSTTLSYVLDGQVAFERTIPAGGVRNIHVVIAERFGFDADEIDVLLTSEPSESEPLNEELARYLDTVLVEQLNELREEIIRSIQYLAQRYAGRAI
ncbi:MAG: pilus assembly protein PilM, partial [Phycisphaerales bacterium]|nr:pilus assembly protein PilM [Phycisphaerales bacterium]